MDRAEAIIIIDGLYPPDSQWEDTNKIGRRLLEQAKANMWKKESDEVLFEYARLCDIENDKECRRMKGEDSNG